MRKKRRSTPITAAALSVAAAIAFAFPPAGPTVAHAERPVLSSSTPIYGASVPAPAVKPLWQVRLAQFEQDGRPFTSAIAEEGRVFALADGGQLAAYDGASGRKLWTYGAALKPLLAYGQGVLYGLTKDGAVYAVGTNGGKKWTAPIRADKAESIAPVGDTVYVTQNLTLFALDRATGKLLWKTMETAPQYEGGLNGVTETDGVVLRSYAVQGALSSTQINAYDKKTGKQLWTSFRQLAPLAVRDGLVYSVIDEYMVGDNDPANKRLRIAALSLKSGAKKGERVYAWTNTLATPGQYQFGGASGSAFLYGNDLYIYQDQAVAKYDFAAYSANGKPAQRWASPNARDYQPLYAVDGGRLLYQNIHDNGIGVLKTANGQFAEFPNGVQPVQTDLYGKGLYVARADGTLDAYDFASFKPVFSVKLGSRAFEATLQSGGMIYIRSGGTLYGVKLPASLK
ncbi:outer membrane protein assembly factor BamB family protein [Paenibacillus glycinis]|uniref:PQQ-binding-like beta-propeller repeat protein n=1 Tax=Paenibacillus glycinis TaxID=2697035 RepID=A0ABW9XRL0_9BACL|nr:PQQ-binding-like beta-propeller repeat protein [Paenibacillus glycinis]NBD25288.1 PQQ-binding-like beta-propeller repeat protein [Paenibacillus glycinis]